MIKICNIFAPTGYMNCAIEWGWSGQAGGFVVTSSDVILFTLLRATLQAGGACSKDFSPSHNE